MYLTCPFQKYSWNLKCHNGVVYNSKLQEVVEKFEVFCKLYFCPKELLPGIQKIMLILTEATTFGKDLIVPH